MKQMLEILLVNKIYNFSFRKISYSFIIGFSEIRVKAPV